MKRFLFVTILLLAVSLACQTLTRAVTPPTSTPAAARPTESAATEAPASTVAPEATATSEIIPTPEPITCTDDSCLQACLERINTTLQAQQFDPLSEAYAGKEVTVGLVAYKVKGDQIVDPVMLSAPPDYKVYQQDTAAQLRIWNYFTAILPTDLRVKWISEFRVFTDGPSNTLAWVRRSDKPDKWILGADILDSRNPVNLTETLLHEFGHLLTLNTEQLTVSDTYIYSGEQGLSNCPQYAAPDGCSNPNSYINLFYQKFWKKIYAEWFTNVDQASNGELNWDLVSAFHDRYADQFVSVYAASHPEEDIAESFATFMLSPRPEGNSIADQKVAFFYQFPELVQLRQFAIQGMCSYTQ